MSTIKAYPKKERAVDDVTEPKYVTATEPANDAEKHALDINIASATTDLPIDPGPLRFLLDGVDQEVTEDTVDPANNRPLPVKLTDITGDINITANDLNVALDATSDSVRLGDGTNLSSINASGQLLVKADELETGLATLEASLTSLESKVDASNVLLTSIDGKDFATQTTLSSLEVKTATAANQVTAISELQDIEADLESIDARIAVSNTKLDTLELGKATATNQASIISELQDQEALLTSLDAKDFATETSLAVLNAKVTAVDTTGKSTEAKQDSIISELQDIELDIESTNTKLDTVITEQTAQGLSLDDVNTELDSQTVLLTSLDGKDYATAAKQDLQTTELQSIKTNSLSGSVLAGIAWDYTVQTQAALTDTFEFKNGGSAGTTVATIVITYTDTSKEIIDTVERS